MDGERICGTVCSDGANDTIFCDFQGHNDRLVGWKYYLKHGRQDECPHQETTTTTTTKQITFMRTSHTPWWTYIYTHCNKYKHISFEHKGTQCACLPWTYNYLKKTTIIFHDSIFCLWVFSECVSTVWNKQIGEVKDEGRIDEHTDDKRDDWALCCNIKNEQVTAAKATSLLS